MAENQKQTDTAKASVIVHSRDVKVELKPGVWSLAISATSKSIFVGNDNSSEVLEYDSESKKQKRCINTGLKGVRAIRVSAHSRFLAVGGDDLIVYDLAKSKQLFRRSVKTVMAIAFSPNDEFVGFGTNKNTAGIVKLPEGTEVHSFEASRGPVLAVSFDADSKTFATGGIDKAIRIWDVGTGKASREIPTPLSVASAIAYTKDGRYIAYTGTQHVGPIVDPLALDALNEIRIWDLEKDAATATLKDEITQMKTVFAGNEATVIVCGSSRDGAFAWQRKAETGRYALVWTDPRSKVLAISPDGKKIATLRDEGLVAIWELVQPVR